MATLTAEQLAHGRRLVDVTFGDKPFKCSWYVYQHLLFTQFVLSILYPGLRIHVMQTCYHTGYEPSAGTHDRDAVLDVWIDGMDPWDMQWFFRMCGWWAWWRHTGTWAKPSAWHIHMISGGWRRYRLPVGDLIPSQDDAYHARRLGLAREVDGPDGSRFPTDIDATIFDLTRWENPMTALTDTCTRLGISYVKGGRLLLRAGAKNTKAAARLAKIRAALGAAPKE